MLDLPARIQPKVVASVYVMAFVLSSCASPSLEQDLDHLAPPCPRTVEYIDNVVRGGDDAQNTIDPPVARPEDAADYVEVAIYYATNRRRSDSCRPAEIYGAQPGRLELGRALVSIPHDHRMGEIESPSILRFEFSRNPQQHITVLSVDPTEAAGYFAELRKTVASTARRQAFVFIHGYNTTFEDSAHRTAQIAYDLKFPGAPILYSWPSAGTVPAYLRDRKAGAESAAPLAAFLEDLRRESGAETIHLIAHSMGNLPLSLALGVMVTEANEEDRPLFQEVVLAAPDIDAEAFERDIAPALGGAADRVTLYTSAHDRALRLARDFADFPRLGDATMGIVVHEGIETIDASFMDTSLTGHSYFGENRSVMSDLYNLLQNREPAGVRFGLVRVDSPMGTYWKFQR